MDEMVDIKLTVNGEQRTVGTDPERSLLDVLREDLGLAGTKYGCGEARCGACSVVVEGRRAFACRTSVKQAEGREVRTIEGLAEGEELHPVQRAFLEEGAFQCGFCTAGMIMAAVALLEAKPRPTDEEIVKGMDRNLCRCGCYPRIVAAVRRASGREG
jgi:aerobic-type carbon monoxide dehydrogenase small subunit (CoxS/CutS family)